MRILAPAIAGAALGLLGFLAGHLTADFRLAQRASFDRDYCRAELSACRRGLPDAGAE